MLRLQRADLYDIGVTDAASENNEQKANDVLDQMFSMLGEAKRLLNPSELAKSATNLVGNTISTGSNVVQPAWKRVTEGESRWAAAFGVLCATLLQLPIPDSLILLSRWILPTITLILLAIFISVSPNKMGKRTQNIRMFSLFLIALVSAANVYSGTVLIYQLATGKGFGATTLLTVGACVWLTNIIVFALWYWEFDRGGPADRANAIKPFPDFMFPQMEEPNLASPTWEPRFFDYLYLSFTNATAFSPTDVMPLTRWSKMTMMTQACVSLVVVALVVARAVNVLNV